MCANEHTQLLPSLGRTKCDEHWREEIQKYNKNSFVKSGWCFQGRMQAHFNANQIS